MPYCCQCGNRTRETDYYCAVCGAGQAGAGKAAGPASGISPNAAAALSYIPIVGWIPAIVVLASQRFRDNREVRFHAFQGLYLFVVWLIVDWVISPVRHFVPFPHPGGHLFMAGTLEGILKLAIFVLWIFMLIKTAHGQTHKLPLLGELAERSVSEQAG